MSSSDFYIPICCFLVPDIEDLPPAVQEKLFDEVLDRDVQKGEIFTPSSLRLSVVATISHTLCLHMDPL